MVERLVANLVENAVRYNEPDGWVTAWTGVRDGEPTLEVTNAGPVVKPEQVDELVKPFSRLDGNGRSRRGTRTRARASDSACRSWRRSSTPTARA